MKDAWHMCTNSVNVTGLNNIVMWCQMIFQFYAGIILKVMGDGLDSRQVKSLGQRMDVYKVQLLLPVSLDDMCNSLVCIKLFCILSVFFIIVHIILSIQKDCKYVCT